MKILAISQDFSVRDPSGNAMLRVLNPMSARHRITCIGGSARPSEMSDSIEYIRVIRFAKLGMLLSLLSFHVSHFLAFLWLTAVKRQKFDIMQVKDGESFIGNVITFNFCDAAYLHVAFKNNLFRPHGMIGFAATAHLLALCIFRTLVQFVECRSSRTRKIIAASRGLADDIEKYYKPRTRPVVVPNAAP